ncbi:hypothetical protein SAMN02745165_00377 [Malonomonas rubra DSM 5091]|uniref:Uncharacterized protein n=1 Tax=Malonomonas rubra DSM 5091 TaxID=1122189 RepID=A0A1M6C1W0_MALRU|nr:hypothetical protein [Malonomonas rubra]SHI55016.1 hypothetical protein SAMN02745165_00377 [Malonomonas rubra DSM 5091]
MKTVLIGKKTSHGYHSFIKSLLQTLCVDVFPILLLLAILAGGMTFVAAKLSEPRSVEIVQLGAKHS